MDATVPIPKAQADLFIRSGHGAGRHDRRLRRLDGGV